MKKLSMFLMAAGALLLGSAAMAAQPQVNICHLPPGNPANVQSINVGATSVPAHLAHGDYVVGDPCTVGEGGCEAEGATVCGEDGPECNAQPGEPTDEVCDDGLDNDCDGETDEGCGPSPCDGGTDPETGDAWVVCAADANTAWISAADAEFDGTYRSDLICQQLGYLGVSQIGGNCGSVCGYCEIETSCSSPGQRVFDGQNSCVLPYQCYTVTWECSN